MSTKGLTITTRIRRFLVVCAFALCFGLLAVTTQAYAVTYPVTIDSTSFPDATFRSYVATNFDDGDGQLSQAEADAVTGINVNIRGIVSLEGIECFSNLQLLYCSNNQLTSLDVTQNPALIDLRCEDNQLTSLDVTQNPALGILYCNNNQLTTLDVTQNPALREVNCDDNQLTALDVTQNPALRGLYCYKNQLTALDVTQNPALRYLSCNNNQLTALDVTQNPALQNLYCNINQLTSLDVTQNPALGILYCNNNQLTSLDVTQNPALGILRCYSNQLTFLDVTQNPRLLFFWCFYNQLTSLDVTKNPALREFLCDNNQLTSLDVTQNPALQNLQCDNNQLTSLDVTKNPELAIFSCNNNQLTSLVVTKNPLLTDFYCHYNQLTSLDVTQNPVLTDFWCHNNQLTSLDVTQNPALTELLCSNNQLTSLDVTQNPALTYIACSTNQLTSLDVRQNPVLVRLYCYSNQLTSLDVTQNFQLGLFANHFLYHDNRLLDISGWPGKIYAANGNLQTVSMSVRAVDPGSSSFVSTTAFAFSGGHTISFPGGETSYDPVTGLFTTTRVNTPVVFETYEGTDCVASGTITFFASCTIVFAPGEHGTWDASDETYTVNPGDAAPVFGAKSGADIATDHDKGWTFDRWSTAIVDPVTGDATYTALWTQDVDGKTPPAVVPPTEEAPTALPKTGDSATAYLITCALVALYAGAVMLRRKAVR